MLPDKNRLPREIFTKLKSDGKVVQGNYLAVVYRINDVKNARFGITVSTKISKLATDRNRIKRMLRQIIKNLMPKINENYDILILTKRKIMESKDDVLSNDLENVLNKANLIL